jgi:CubicO group peptidase (beta-lactamase class C family)
LIYSKASGYMSVNRDAAPIALDSTFVLGSCTKILTAIAALQCVERGLVTLDEPLDKYLPELAKLPIITPDETTATTTDGKDVPPTPASVKYHLTPVKTHITLRLLLTHTAGSSYPTMNPYIQAWRESNGQSLPAMTGNLLEDYSFPLVHEPGTSFAYGANYDWASLLVGRLNKTTFGDFAKENIFTPLGMTSSTFHLEQAEHVRQKLVTMSIRAGAEAGGLIAGDNGLPDPAKDELGGVGLYSSVPDYLKLLGDIISDKPVLLKPETIDLLFTPQFEVDCKPFETLNALGVFAWKFFMSDDDFKMNHGLGSALTTEEAQVSGTPKGTIRWSGYSGPMWAANREKGLAWFYATQVLPFGDVESGKRAEAFGKAVFAQ